MNDKKLTTIGLLGAIAVAFGALGAHFLKAKVELDLMTTDQLNGFDTGVKYQMYHSIMLFALFLLAKHHNHKFINWAYYCFIIGIVLFSGSLYLLCTRTLFHTEWLTFLGPITPLGGLFFIAGWILLAMVGLQKSTSK